MTKIAILIEDDFNEDELIYPYHRLREEGFEVELVGSEPEEVYVSEEGYTRESDICTTGAKPEDYEAVFIPGGYSPDHMRVNENTVKFVRAIYDAGKPVGAICHAGWMLAESLDLKGKKLTSVSNIKTDLINAGADWVDEEAVVDENLITGRTPKDLAPMVKAFIDQIKK